MGSFVPVIQFSAQHLAVHTALVKTYPGGKGVLLEQHRRDGQWDSQGGDSAESKYRM